MAFFAELGARCRALVHNLRHDLRPNVAVDDGAAKRLRRNFVYHLHPMRVTERALAPGVTLGLGLASVALFLLLSATGLLLMLYYVPTPRDAYASMLDLEHAVTLGAFVRRLHRFAAHAMVAVVALHLVRVLAQAAYRRRELNWLIGLSLFAMLLGLAFTGYLLPWDQTAYWAVRVVTNMVEHVPLCGRALEWLLLGGTDVGGATLVRFYALHVAILPAFMLLFVALHLWRVRRDGGLATSEAELPTLPAWPHMTLRVGNVILAVIAVMVLLSLVVDAPLGPPADMLRPANPEKAPWYFLGLQEMVSYSATVGGVLFPSLLLLLLSFVPFFDREEQGIGVWLGPPASRRGLALDALISAAVLVCASVAFMAPETIEALRAAPAWLKDVLNPATGALVWGALLFFVQGRVSGSIRGALRATLVAYGLALVLFTLIGLWRGPDWTFYWPWQEWLRVR